MMPTNIWKFKKILIISSLGRWNKFVFPILPSIFKLVTLDIYIKHEDTIKSRENVEAKEASKSEMYIGLDKKPQQQNQEKGSLER